MSNLNEKKPNLPKLNNKRFQMTEPDYYELNTKRKYLHFFQNDENKINFLDLKLLLNSDKTKDKNIFQTIDLDIDFEIPAFHKVIFLIF